MSHESENAVASIEATWAATASEAEAVRCVKQMLNNPSKAWRRYLDELHTARSSDANMTVIDEVKLRVLAPYEDELYGSVAEAIAREDGLVTS